MNIQRKIEKIKRHNLYIYRQESEGIIDEKYINVRKLSIKEEIKIYLLYI